MKSATTDLAHHKSPVPRHMAAKIWREVARPFRRMSRPRANGGAARFDGYLTGSGVGFEGFHPQQATVEVEGIALIERLVRQSRQYPGPIIEVGTLLGITTTTIALVKAPEQKVITVDNYCWNPWAISPDAHEALAHQVLFYLIKTGHVERVRMDKNEFFRTYGGPAPSMVFLDAVHDYPETKKDIEWAQQMGTKIIAGHDYCKEFAGVMQVVDEFGGPRELGGTVWVL